MCGQKSSHIKPHKVNRLRLIRSSPLAGLCYDTPSVEVVLFPVATPDKTPDAFYTVVRLHWTDESRHEPDPRRQPCGAVLLGS